MKIKNLISAFALATFLMSGMNANADNINFTQARSTASNYLKQHAAATPGSLRAPAVADLKLAYTEASTVTPDANAYYCPITSKP